MGFLKMIDDTEWLLRINEQRQHSLSLMSVSTRCTSQWANLGHPEWGGDKGHEETVWWRTFCQLITGSFTSEEKTEGSSGDGGAVINGVQTAHIDTVFTPYVTGDWYRWETKSVEWPSSKLPCCHYKDQITEQYTFIPGHPNYLQ